MLLLKNCSKRCCIPNTKLPQLSNPILRYFSQTGEIIQSEKRGRIKTVDKMVWFNVVCSDGTPRRVFGYPGEILVDVLERGGISGVQKSCGGGDQEYMPYEVPVDFFSDGPGCFGCHINIPPPYDDKIYKSCQEQSELDHSATSITPYSRLACCIQVRKWMDEMVIVVGDNSEEFEDGLYSPMDGKNSI